MRILKHSWVSHGANLQLFSVDIHPKDEKFVTGGPSSDGGRIIIWNLAPIVNLEDEINVTVPKKLCQIDSHDSCVNIVRWSCDGQYLASGDDKLVMIWKLSIGDSSSFGGKKNVENWKSVARLRGHLGDVFDVAWAPNDNFLATASVDNTVVVWNARNFPEKVAVLRDHIDMVKGVAWDPIGQYLATQSADRTLRIWRTADWSQEKIVSDCFTDCTATTHVLRLSWSPEGKHLVSAHAMNGGGPTAQIIDRDGWKLERDAVGHRKAVTCVRFNPNIFKKNSEPYCCFAVGSRDCSLSVWHTSLQRPLVYVKDLFLDSIVDIAWSSNGYQLIICSLDGKIAFIEFTSTEMGTPLALNEKDLLYEKLYDQSLQQSWNRNLGAKPLLESKRNIDDITDSGTEVSVVKKRRITPTCTNPVVTAPVALQITCSSTIIDGHEPVVRFVNGDKSDFDIKIQITNAFRISQELVLAKIERCQKLDDRRSTWETYLRSSVKCIAVNRKMVVACCEDFTVNCLSVDCGSKIWPSLLLEDLAVSLILNAKNECLVVMKSGFLHMWNFETGTSILSHISLKTLLSNNASVKECGLSENGSPVVTLTNGRVYSYQVSFKMWAESSNPLDSFNKIIGGEMGPVPPEVKLSVLESKLFASLPNEYKYWLMATVNHLVQNGPKCRLRSILEGFIGSSVLSTNDKHSVLNEILKILEEKLEWKNLYGEYYEMLDKLEQ